MQNSYKSTLHEAKKVIAKNQELIAQRRFLLLHKLLPLIENDTDKKVIESALIGKNLTPRYY